MKRVSKRYGIICDAVWFIWTGHSHTELFPVISHIETVTEYFIRQKRVLDAVDIYLQSIKGNKTQKWHIVCQWWRRSLLRVQLVNESTAGQVSWISIQSTFSQQCKKYVFFVVMVKEKLAEWASWYVVDNRVGHI